MLYVGGVLDSPGLGQSPHLDRWTDGQISCLLPLPSLPGPIIPALTAAFRGSPVFDSDTSAFLSILSKLAWGKCHLQFLFLSLPKVGFFPLPIPIFWSLTQLGTGFLSPTQVRRILPAQSHFAFLRVLPPRLPLSQPPAGIFFTSV